MRGALENRRVYEADIGKWLVPASWLNRPGRWQNGVEIGRSQGFDVALAHVAEACAKTCRPGALQSQVPLEIVRRNRRAQQNGIRG